MASHETCDKGWLLFQVEGRLRLHMPSESTCCYREVEGDAARLSLLSRSALPWDKSYASGYSKMAFRPSPLSISVR